MADEKSPGLTQEDLPERNRLNQLILDSLPCVALLLRASTREIVASNQAARKVGAIPGTTCFATWGQRETPCPWCLAPSLWETGQPQHLEIEASGTVWDAHWLPVEPDLYMHYAFDITERKQMENALAEEAIRKRALFEQSKDGIVILDQNGKVYDANQQFGDMLGYSLEEVQQLHVWDWEAQWTREQLLEMFQRVGADGERFETVHRRKDGTVYEVEITADWIMLAGQQVGFCVCRDISPRKAAERALSESEERFRVLVEEASDAFFVHDFNGRFYDVNRRACESLGYTREELLHLGVFDLEQDADLARAQKDWEQIQPGQALTLYGHHRRKDNTVFPVEIHLSVISIQGRRLILGLVRDITEQQQARAALEESLSLYKATLESTADGLLVADLHGRMVSWNRKFMEMWRIPEDIVTSRNDDRALAYVLDQLEDPQGFLQKVRGLYSQPAAESFDVVNFKDGRVFERYSIPQYLDTKIMGRVWSFRDVTARVRAEEALRQSEENFRLINENIQDVFWMSTASIDKIIYVSPAYEELWGRTRESLYAAPRSFLDAIHPEDREKAIAMAEHAQGIPWNQEYRVIRPDGSIRWIQNRGFPIKDDQGNLRLVAGVATDITERKRTEEAFKKLVVNAPIGIFIVQNRKIKVVNPGLQAITGYREDELLGKDSYGCVAPEFEKFVSENVSRMMKGLSSVPFEFQVINKNGERRWVMESVAPTQHEGEPATLVYLMDISAKKGLEEQLLQAQKMEAVGTLAGGLAHDFNNILTAILGNIGLAMLDGEIGPKVQERLTQAEQACLRAQALSQQLLTFAKGGAPIKKIISIGTILKRCTTLMLSGSKSSCDLSIPEDLWSVEADEGQIYQVISNLVINADQAMPEGGIIKIKAENILAEAESNIPIKGKYVKLTFIDQGAGIPSRYLDKIFDPYFTTKQKGSGLGLATVYSIIKNHSGYIKVESPVEAGATFYIYLPARETKVLAEEPAGMAKPPKGHGRVLVMDDDEMVRKVLNSMLGHLGYEAEFARDGSQALERFVRARADGRPFAAVILDLTVPGGMGGKDAIKELLKIDPQVKAIVSSGYSDDPIMADFKKYGFCEVIAKPFRVMELSKILQKIMSKAN